MVTEGEAVPRGCGNGADRAPAEGCRPASVRGRAPGRRACGTTPPHSPCMVFRRFSDALCVHVLTPLKSGVHLTSIARRHLTGSILAFS